jgi:hypothetical protein
LVKNFRKCSVEDVGMRDRLDGWTMRRFRIGPNGGFVTGFGMFMFY